MSSDSKLEKSDFLLPERDKKLKNAAANRQHDLTVILENVHDPHNIGAVLRSCDAVGISEIFVISEKIAAIKSEKKIGKNSASGSRKWVKVHYFEDTTTCLKEVRKKYKFIFGTHLDSNSTSLYDLDLTASVALMFGNEHLGLSEEAVKGMDGNFTIPQVGMVQSLNVSVACAVSIFEAMRQRLVSGHYNSEFDKDNFNHAESLDYFFSKQFPRI